MEHDPVAVGNLAGQLGAGKSTRRMDELEDGGRDLERSVTAAPIVEQALHPFLLEGVDDQVEGSTRVAVLHRRPDHGDAVHEVRAEHLVLGLYLVGSEEEGVVAEEQGGTDRLGATMEQTGDGKGLAPLFLGQRGALLEVEGSVSGTARYV